MTRLAIIGLGSWGRKLVESVQGVSTAVQFTTVVSRQPERVADFARKHGLAVTSDYAAALANRAVDGVVSSGPAHLHGAHGLAALAAGKPLLAIKPMALRGDEARRMLEMSRATGALLALGYNRCFYPNVAEMRRRLRSGAIGDVVHVEGDFCVDRFRSIPRGGWKGDPANAPAGALADHMLYLAIETIGAMEWVHALGFRQHSDNELADTTAVLLRSRSQRSALLTAIGVTPDFYRFHVFGTQGWIEIRDDTDFAFQPLNGPRQDIRFEPVDAERAEVEAFAAAIRGEAEFPTPADDAAHGVAVIEAMGRSALENRPISVE